MLSSLIRLALSFMLCALPHSQLSVMLNSLAKYGQRRADRVRNLWLAVGSPRFIHGANLPLICECHYFVAFVLAPFLFHEVLATTFIVPYFQSLDLEVNP